MNTHRSFFRILLCCLAVLVSWSLTLPPMALAEDRPKAQPGTLKSVLEKGTLRVGVSLFTPWTIKQQDGQLVGYEIDVAKQLAKDLGVKPQFHVFDWEKIIPALLSRKIDIIIAGIVITPQRALKVNFSQPYDSSGIGLVTNIALTKTFQGLKDLNRPDVIIATVTGTISEDLARRVFSKVTLKTFATSQEAIEAVTSGKVHGYVEHEAITTFVALDHPELVDEPLSKPLLETKAGFAVHKGDPDFIHFLNAWIISHEADTWLNSAHKYWFEGVEWRKDVATNP
jgi:polar amino acid transport system substrate-binding protein